MISGLWLVVTGYTQEPSLSNISIVMNILVDENESNDCADDILDVLPVIEYPRVMSLLKIDWPLYRMVSISLVLFNNIYVL